MRCRVAALTSAVALAVAAVAGCSGGLSLRDDSGAGISIDEDGDISVGDGTTEIEISGWGSPGSSDGGALVTDELITIATDGGTVDQECGGRSVNVVANSATVALTGSCALLTITGSDNQVSVESATEVSVLGSNNTVRYASGDPVVTDLGSGNSVEPGGSSAP
ncbi:DUF3060 domain-containing protein [Thermobifida fusca]|nr:DUF3060 domain-containing protein [Thermobifida fusca]